MFTEAEQVRLGEQWFTSKGFDTFQEIPIFSNSLDLLVVNEENQFHGVEFKLSNWQKVIEQAKKHKIALDYVSVFLNMPKTTRTEERIIKECISNGIGLFLLEDRSKVIQRVPPRANTIWVIEKEKVLLYLKEYRGFKT